MLHLVVKKKPPLLLPAMMASTRAPIQYLSELSNPLQETRRKKETPEETINEPNFSRSVAPIGYIKSCFKSKNGTPRQPSVCTFSRAKLQVLKSVFVHPDHSLQGLEQFSHVWIMFLFHKNGPETFTKAKVKPPRLNGAKVGVFATRSPHRPNPIGLTLAKLDKIQGGTLHLSGVDIIDGTPVLDIKPYVPTYDNPDNVLNPEKERHRTLANQTVDEDVKERTVEDESETSPNTSKKRSLTRLSSVELHDKQLDMACTSHKCVEQNQQSQTSVFGTLPHPSGIHHCEHDKNAKQFEKLCTVAQDSNTDASTEMSVQSGPTGVFLLPDNNQCSGDGEAEVKVADWIKSPPISKLRVQFTQKAEHQLSAFRPKAKGGTSPDDYALEFFKDTKEARQAICEILEADPRSTYRRKECSDRLYFFAVDTVHVTCWFYDDIAEVIRIQPLSHADIPNS